MKVGGCGFRKDGVVATRGSEPEEELGAFRQVHVAELNGTLGRAPPHGDRWVVTQRLVYRAGNHSGSATTASHRAGSSSNRRTTLPIK